MTKKKSSGPFDYINAINGGKDIQVMSDYSQFLVNRNFSLFNDTVAIAIEANKMTLSNENHFKYYRSMVSIKRRFSKWHKPAKNEDVKLLAQFFDLSVEKAYLYEKLFTKDDIKQIKGYLT